MLNILEDFQEIFEEMTRIEQFTSKSVADKIYEDAEYIARTTGIPLLEAICCERRKYQ